MGTGLFIYFLEWGEMSLVCCWLSVSHISHSCRSISHSFLSFWTYIFLHDDGLYISSMPHSSHLSRVLQGLSTEVSIK